MFGSALHWTVRKVSVSCLAQSASLLILSISIDPSQDGELNSSTLVPFHKLTMWLTYSLIEILQHVLEWKVEGMEDMTGLPEYRNGKRVSHFA